MAGKGGGSWKVAYADFVTAMMAFFMVMWILAQNKPVQEGDRPLLQRPLENLVETHGRRAGRSLDGAQQGRAATRRRRL